MKTYVDRITDWLDSDQGFRIVSQVAFFAGFIVALEIIATILRSLL